MKPLPPAPLTFEDWGISMDHRNDPRRAYLLAMRFGINREQDRRDAALMWKAQRHRQTVWAGAGQCGPIVRYRQVEARYRQVEADRYTYIDCGGALLGMVAGDDRRHITYFA